MLVDLVGDDPHVVLHGPLADRADRLATPHGTGRVVRGGDDDGLRALGPSGLDGGDVGLETTVGAANTSTGLPPASLTASG